MQNYWPFNNNLDDVIDGSNLYGGQNWGFIAQGKNGPALSLGLGYLNAPSGIYFSGDLTIMAWVYVFQHQTYQRLIDFGNGKGIDNVVCALSRASTGNPYFSIFPDGSIFDSAGFSITKNKWTFVACVLQSSTYVAVYVDSSRNYVSQSSITPTHVVRTKCYVGRSHWYNDPFYNDEDTNAYIDDLKIFNRALSQQEIYDEMNNCL